MSNQTYITQDGRRIIIPWHPALAQMVPHAREIRYNGGVWLLMPNRNSETRIARNLGLLAPAPILTRYDWRSTKPWEIQKTTAVLLTENPRVYVLSELGTGKTRAVLYAIDWLLTTGQISRALICAPLSTLTPVWETEIFRLMLPWKVKVLYGSREKRLELLSQGAELNIINHHGVAVIREALENASFDIVVVDELAVYRNKSTDMWKVLDKIINPRVPIMFVRGRQPTSRVKPPRYVWGLTGSPTPNAPTDAWAQAKLLTPMTTTRTLASFRDQTMARLSEFKWAPRREANQIVKQTMSPSVRYLRSDVMELPECVTVDRSAPLDPAAAKAYKLLYSKARLICEGVKNSGESVTALNEGVLHNKLLQVSCGFVYTDKRTVYELPAKQRLSALDEVLDETDHKVLVLVPYLHAMGGVADYLRSHKRDIAVVSGATPRGQRDVVFTSFQTRLSPRIIVAHPQTLAHGLTLTAADTVVWYSPTMSLEVYDQSNARINRPGQRNNMLIVHMIGTEVERATYLRLRQKQRMQNCLLDLFAQQSKR